MSIISSFSHFIYSFLGRPADTEDHSDINAIDDRRCSTLADQRQRLARDRHISDCHTHIEQRLDDQQQRQSHGQKGREIIFTPAGYAPCAEQQDDIKHGNDKGSHHTSLLDDDGIDKIGKSPYRGRHPEAAPPVG